ncbi:GNAT family N-acetyltransferase [Planobispora siamensis]|uniref:N-acetyltransferase n=1 Tax=Planobispora siamensis TaxID=936338 RepID=A0A8J3SIE0_9ACTN|nr:GNAT family N-acetyltransferase [Planobispora siamensis]GIH94898.1 N-acetyltransferase [Planobispora siamensis]
MEIRSMEIHSMEIRSFVETDRTELRELFARAGEGAPTESLWGHRDSEAAVYLDPYMDLEPHSLLLAVADGAPVGYLTGCPDSSEFPSEADRIDRAVKKHWPAFRLRAAAFFGRAVLDMARAGIRREPTAGDFTDTRWPAHLHIAVVPAARGTGAADALMNHWLDRLRQAGSPGCHLQTLVENTRAVRFFERAGFLRHGPTPVVPGLRYDGRRLHQQTMVWSPQG